jgi:hypothetical protein
VGGSSKRRNMLGEECATYVLGERESPRICIVANGKKAGELPVARNNTGVCGTLHPPRAEERGLLAYTIAPPRETRVES